MALTPIPFTGSGLTSPAGNLIDAAIAEHGARRVAFAAFFALFRSPTVIRDAADLDDRLRKDIGLEVTAKPPNYWDIRR